MGVRSNIYTVSYIIPVIIIWLRQGFPYSFGALVSIETHQRKLGFIAVVEPCAKMLLTKSGDQKQGCRTAVLRT